MSLLKDGRNGKSEGGADLPCLFSNNSIESLREKIKELSTSQRKSASILGWNVKYMAEKHGLENIGFLTLTFPKHITCMKVAGRKFNSLASNFLREHFNDFISVKERHKSGRIHFHLVVNCGVNIRRGINFAEIENRIYRSANKNLRNLWQLLRENVGRYGFGRTELLPVKSTSEAIGRYVGKYISKNVQCRPDEDKGTRLVNYSGDSRYCSTRFMWVTENSYQWRMKVKTYIELKNKARKLNNQEPINEQNISRILGSKWCYNHLENILFTPIKTQPTAATVGHLPSINHEELKDDH